MQLSGGPDHNFDIYGTFGDSPDPSRLYYALFQKIPSCQEISKIHASRVKNWLNKEFSDKADSRVIEQNYDHDARKMRYSEALYLLNDDLMVRLTSSQVKVYHHQGVSTQADALIQKLQKFIRRKKPVREFSLITSGERGLEANSLRYPKPKLQLEYNYNEDMLESHQRILTLMKKNEQSGLYIFHGEPGTGKSTYIRYLLHSISKRVCFMPPGLAENLESPALAKFLLNYRNSIFIIEDAENLIASRNLNKGTAISMMLNLTDGILGDSLGIQVIATCNTSISNIDQAFLRKGRLLQLLEFKALTTEKTNTLLEKLGHTGVVVNRPMTLAEIYHYSEQGYQREKNGIGFLAAG